jgi:hypothetical protein
MSPERIGKADAQVLHFEQVVGGACPDSGGIGDRNARRLDQRDPPVRRIREAAHAMPFAMLVHVRDFGAAALNRGVAARSEATSRERFVQRRHVARDRFEQVTALVDVGQRAEQPVCIRMQRLREEVLLARQLDQLARIHDADAIGDLRDDRRVSA